MLVRLNEQEGTNVDRDARDSIHLKMKSLLMWLVALSCLTTAEGSSLRTVRVLDGQVSFSVPKELGHLNSRSNVEDRYDDLIALQTPDRRLCAVAKVGRYPMQRHQLQRFLEAKVASCANLKTQHRHFHWINHRLVERQQREWAEVSFKYDRSPPPGREAYGRSVSTVLNGHLVEVWAMSRAAEQPGEQAVIDRIIDSVKLLPASATAKVAVAGR
jgi:hypothetical protein